MLVSYIGAEFLWFHQEEKYTCGIRLLGVPCTYTFLKVLSLQIMHKLHLLDAIPSKPNWLLSQNPGVYYLKQGVQEYKTNQGKKRGRKKSSSTNLPTVYKKLDEK